MDKRMITQQKMKGTIGIIAVNAVVFLVLSFMGQTEDGLFMMNHGAMYVPEMRLMGSYWMIVTSMFLHFGIEHIVSNMLMLGVIGRYLEPELGTVKFLITYLLCGIGGNVASMAADIHFNDYSVSAGASGAIFGMCGVLLHVVIVNKGRIEDLTTRGMIAIIALSGYVGFTTSGVDNFAHMGGLACGIILGMLLYQGKR